MNDPAGERARFWALALPLVAATALLGAVACPGLDAQPEPERHTVEMRGFEFQPASLTLAPGDTVVWVNRDAVPHTATGSDGTWDSGSIASGASWSHVVTAVDSAAYTCTFHPTMTGILVVR